jgi:DNA (cytosine-5)-methyltransferase 1
MGLSEGHVVGVPGLTRSARLKALGNGVVPQQAAAALALLVERAGITASSA